MCSVSFMNRVKLCSNYSPCLNIHTFSELKQKRWTTTTFRVREEEVDEEETIQYMVIRVSAPPAGFGCLTGTSALWSTPPPTHSPTSPYTHSASTCVSFLRLKYPQVNSTSHLLVTISWREYTVHDNTRFSPFSVGIESSNRKYPCLHPLTT